jgi:tripartite-type tricarboxylate transporter receptor subunit TctC
MTFSRRSFLHLAAASGLAAPRLASAAGVALLTLASPLAAQTWPQQQPVKIIVGLAAGGTTDTIARVIAQSLTERLGQTFVVENRPGGAQSISAEAVARAPADGYTLLMANTPQMAIAPAILKARYDAVKDFEPVSIVGSNGFVLCVNANLPVSNLAEFVAYAKKQPGLNYASGGVGNFTHLSMAYFAKLAGLDMTHVPYKGGAPAMSDLIAGHVPAMFASVSDALSQIKAGKIKPLAVSGLERAPELPDVPTVRESGYPTFQTVTWNGLMAPAKTPKAIVDRLGQEIALAVKDPKVIQHLAQQGIKPVGNTPAEFAQSIAEDVKFWKEVVTLAGVKE